MIVVAIAGAALAAGIVGAIVNTMLHRMWPGLMVAFLLAPAILYILGY